MKKLIFLSVFLMVSVCVFAQKNNLDKLFLTYDTRAASKDNPVFYAPSYKEISFGKICNDSTYHLQLNGEVIEYKCKLTANEGYITLVTSRNEKITLRFSDYTLAKTPKVNWKRCEITNKNQDNLKILFKKKNNY